MATFRGQDSTITYDSETIGEVTSINMSGIETDLIEDTVKGDTFKSYKGGLVDGGEISVACRLDYANTGQAAIVDDVIAAAGTAKAVVVTIGAGKTFTQSAVALGYTVDSPEGSSIVGVTYRMKITTAVTVAWA